MKKIITLSLVLAMVLSTGIRSQASEMTQAEKLNTLNILLGDGNDYMLEETMERSHAAAFIVRLLGVEQEVLDNQAAYVETSFNDVPTGAWYAPYVGYVEQEGIVNGFGDGSFRPNDPVSEKAFLKLILGSLGYIYNYEFNWNSIYSFSYQLGLIDDKKTNDDRQYQRGLAVDVMERSLGKEINEEKRTVLDRLLEKDVVTLNEAVQAGYVEDEKVTAVESAFATGDTITVVLNEAIQDLDSSQVDIIDGENESLTVTSVRVDDNELVIETADMVFGGSYQVVLTQLLDAQGIVTDIIETSVAYTEVEAIESDYFQVSKVEAVSKNLIEVTFTQPVSLNATLPTYFKIYEGDDLLADNTFSDLDIGLKDDDTIGIWLENESLEENKMYSLWISEDLKGVYGLPINNGQDLLRDFIGSGQANAPLYIESLEPVNDDFIRIIYSQPVTNSDAVKTGNYTLSKEDGSMQSAAFDVIATGTGPMENRQYDIKYMFSDDQEYRLVVENVTTYTKAQEVDDSDEYGYVHYDREVPAFVMEAIAAFDNRHLVVYLNSPVDDLTGIGFTGVSVGDRFIDPDNPKAIHLYTSSDLTSGASYELGITLLKDIYNRSLDTTVKMTFDGPSLDRDDITIRQAHFVGPDTLLAQFNKDLNTGALTSAAFKVTYKDSDGEDQSISAQSISTVSKDTVIVRFDDLDNEDYKLEVTSVPAYYHGTASNVTKTVERE